MRKLLLPLICLILCFAAPPAQALQKYTRCQCMAAPLKKRWNDAGAVFTGEIIDIKEVEKWMERGNDDLPVIVTVRVDEGFKGLEKGNLFKIHSNIHKNTCMGADFAKGKTFLFFAYERVPEIYETWSLYDFPSGTYDVGGLCGGSKEMSDPLTAPEITEIKGLTTDAPLLTPDKEGIYGLPKEKPITAPE